MPRLFPNLGRSSKEQASAYGHYEGYDAPHGYYDYGYEEQEPQQQSSAWRKVFPRKSSAKRNYLRRDDGNFARPGAYGTAMEEFGEQPMRGVPVRPMDDAESFEELLAGPHRSDVPLVQRESSLTRLQQAFADHGTYAPTMSAAPSGSHGAPFYAPQPMPTGQPHLGAVNDMHEPPVVVQSTLPRRDAVHPDIVHHAASYPSRIQPILRRRERERSAPPRVKPSRGHPAYWEKPLEPEEEPPVVVVVEHGKNGKKDKYYIIPGGAPVIFEDEEGNELTRVGDFSGRYKPPRRPRPVIIQDQYGHEICRAGFNNDDQISMGSRSMDGSAYHSESGRSHHRGRTQHVHEQREHGSHHGSTHPSSRVYAPDSYIRDPHYQSSRGRAGTRSPHNDLDYVSDPRPPRSERSTGSGSTLIRSTSPRYDDHRIRPRTYERRDRGPEEQDHVHRGDYGRRDMSRSGSKSSSSGSYDDLRVRHYPDRYG